MAINLIVAHGAKTRVIGTDTTESGLLWNIQEDMNRFKGATSGHPVIMGRKTWETIPATFRPLRRRTNIVLSRDPDFAPEGVIVVRSVEEALAAALAAEGSEEVFVMGGAEIYELFLPFADRLILTIVEREPEGNAFFPPYEHLFPRITENEAREEGFFRFTFQTRERA